MLAAQVLADVAKNAAMGVPAIKNARLLRSRTTRPANETGLNRLFRSFIKPVEDLRLVGKSVLEIGPGDNLVTGLAFLAMGARSYTAIDRFPGNYASKEAVEWYALLAKRMLVASIDDPRISIKAGAVEDVGFVGRFDIVCSHAVGEHVRSVPDLANFTRRSLAPGGVALHVVDFSGHHWHRDDDPDLFMRFPEWLWQAMGSNRGLPNRVPPTEFLAAFERAGLVAHAKFAGATHAEIRATRCEPSVMAGRAAF